VTLPDLPALGGSVFVGCPRCQRLGRGEVVEVREDAGEVYVECPHCEYVLLCEP
jgi:uncharacterized C2H2 Zn-finger protein